MKKCRACYNADKGKISQKLVRLCGGRKYWKFFFFSSAGFESNFFSRCAKFFRQTLLAAKRTNCVQFCLPTINFTIFSSLFFKKWAISSSPIWLQNWNWFQNHFQWLIKFFCWDAKIRFQELRILQSKMADNLILLGSAEFRAK